MHSEIPSAGIYRKNSFEGIIDHRFHLRQVLLIGGNPFRYNLSQIQISPDHLRQRRAQNIESFNIYFFCDFFEILSTNYITIAFALQLQQILLGPVKIKGRNHYIFYFHAKDRTIERNINIERLMRQQRNPSEYPSPDDTAVPASISAEPPTGQKGVSSECDPDRNDKNWALQLLEPG